MLYFQEHKGAPHTLHKNDDAVYFESIYHQNTRICQTSAYFCLKRLLIAIRIFSDPVGGPDRKVVFIIFTIMASSYLLWYRMKSYRLYSSSPCVEQTKLIAAILALNYNGHVILHEHFVISFNTRPISVSPFQWKCFKCEKKRNIAKKFWCLAGWKQSVMETDFRSVWNDEETVPQINTWNEQKCHISTWFSIIWASTGWFGLMAPDWRNSATSC